MTLVKDMIGDGDDYSCLKEFKALTGLRILGKDWMKTLYDCLVLLQHVPWLSEVEFKYDLRFARVPEVEESLYHLRTPSSPIVEKITFPKLTKMTFPKYYTRYRKDLEILMNDKLFPCLDHLEIDSMRAAEWNWRVQRQSAELSSFFAYMYKKVSVFKLTFTKPNHVGVLELLETYYQAISKRETTRKKDKFAVKLKMGYMSSYVIGGEEDEEEFSLSGGASFILHTNQVQASNQTNIALLIDYHSFHSITGQEDQGV